MPHPMVPLRFKITSLVILSQIVHPCKKIRLSLCVSIYLMTIERSEKRGKSQACIRPYGTLSLGMCDLFTIVNNSQLLVSSIDKILFWISKVAKSGKQAWFFGQRSWLIWLRLNPRSLGFFVFGFFCVVGIDFDGDILKISPQNWFMSSWDKLSSHPSETKVKSPLLCSTRSQLNSDKYPRVSTHHSLRSSPKSVQRSQTSPVTSEPVLFSLAALVYKINKKEPPLLLQKTESSSQSKFDTYFLPLRVPLLCASRFNFPYTIFIFIF